jgi:hypothetical protein
VLHEYHSTTHRRHVSARILPRRPGPPVPAAEVRLASPSPCLPPPQLTYFAATDSLKAKCNMARRPLSSKCTTVPRRASRSTSRRRHRSQSRRRTVAAWRRVSRCCAAALYARRDASAVRIAASARRTAARWEDSEVERTCATMHACVEKEAKLWGQDCGAEGSGLSLLKIQYT